MTITIPDEAIEAGARNAHEGEGSFWDDLSQPMRDMYCNIMRDAITAALEQMVASGRARRVTGCWSYFEDSPDALIIRLDGETK